MAPLFFRCGICRILRRIDYGQVGGPGNLTDAQLDANNSFHAVYDAENRQTSTTVALTSFCSHLIEHRVLLATPLGGSTCCYKGSWPINVPRIRVLDDPRFLGVFGRRASTERVRGVIISIQTTTSVPCCGMLPHI